MPPKFKRHLNDDDVTGSVKSERRNLLEDDSDEEEDFFYGDHLDQDLDPETIKLSMFRIRWTKLLM